MKVYLDLDGVLISGRSWKKLTILKDGFPEFELGAVRALNMILDHEACEVILTTSHKHKFTLKQWKSIFHNRNVKIYKISRLPENKDHLSRKQELLRWLKYHQNDRFFLIIDDDKSLNDLNNSLKSKLIQPSTTVGLTEEHAVNAIEILKNLNN